MKSDLPNLLLSYSNSENPEEAVRDPVAAYRLLRQMRKDLIYIEKRIQPNLTQCEEYQNELDSKIPQLEDLDGAASGLIRLQEIYKLHPEDITKETSLNADEAFNVGLVAYDEDKFQHAFLWFLYSLDRLRENSTTTEEELLRFLSYSVYHFGSLSVAIYFSHQLLNLDPSNDEARVQLNRLLHLQSNPDIFPLNTESSNYEALCRGEVDERTSMRQRALSCRYSTGGGNPRLMYAPVKEEVEWDEPRIIRYHDIISDREIEILKNISRPKMSDVEIGGATVFTKVGVSVQPKKSPLALTCIAERYCAFVSVKAQYKKGVLPNLLLSYSDSKNPEEAVRDPVAAYRFLRQMRNDFMYIVKRIQPNLTQCEEYQNELDSKIPQLEDLDGAASGLIKLQEIYKLHPEDITKETSLNADEAFNVGLVAYDEDKFQHAFLWFLYSLDRLRENSTTTEEELLRFLSYSVYHFGSLSVAIYFSHQLLNLDPSNDEARVQLNRLLHLQSNPDIFPLNTESSNYEALCRGEVDERTSKRQRALSCRYSTGGGNPRLMYAPVKEEVEWDEPRIIRYHDIISDREMEILKNISRPQLSRSEVYRSGITKPLKLRVSQSVFLQNNPVEAGVSQRIADVTGLSMETAESLLVQNYGVGGAFEQHIDALELENDRIATFLIYMSDVEIGGATVFPKVGVSVHPKKGSAVLWYNLHRNGEVNWNTEHAGCPVFVGNKWVASTS
ncbi:unnamed protein product [Leuciscus chuanchicus]